MMDALKDPTALALIVALGMVLGWLMISLLWTVSRTFRKVTRKVACFCSFHAPSGKYEPAIGGRDVMRCLYCDTVVYEVQRSKQSLRRVK